MAQQKAQLTGISISLSAREDLRRFQAVAGGVLGRRLTMTEALRLAVAIASDRLADGAEPAARELGFIPSESSGETDQ